MFVSNAIPIQFPKCSPQVQTSLALCLACKFFLINNECNKTPEINCALRNHKSAPKCRQCLLIWTFSAGIQIGRVSLKIPSKYFDYFSSVFRCLRMPLTPTLCSEVSVIVSASSHHVPPAYLFISLPSGGETTRAERVDGVATADVRKH